MTIPSKNPNIKTFKHYTLLSMLYISILTISILLDYKFIKIGGVLASAATFIISSTFFISDIITEVYGYKYGRRVVISGIICLFVIAIIVYFLKDLPAPKAYLKYDNSYTTVLNLFFRAIIANATAISVGSILNVYYMSKWKAIVHGRYFWLRSLGSSIIGESLYTIFVVTLVNIGITTAPQFFQILLVSFFYKLTFDLIAVIPSSLLANYLKKSEQIDVYDFPQNLILSKYTNKQDKAHEKEQ